MLFGLQKFFSSVRCNINYVIFLLSLWRRAKSRYFTKNIANCIPSSVVAGGGRISHDSTRRVLLIRLIIIFNNSAEEIAHLFIREREKTTRAIKKLAINYVLKIYIHNSDEVPGLDMQPQHIWDYKVDRISFSVKQTYTTEDARQLTIKQRHCIFENEVKLKIDHMYTYTACTSQCRMEESKKR